MAKCANRACAVPINASNRSKDNVTYCRECGDFVWAFRPDADIPGDWFVATPADDPFAAEPTSGERFTGGQCSTCGYAGYEIVQVGRRSWVARCVGQDVDGCFVAGCGTDHPVRPKMACEVVF